MKIYETDKIEFIVTYINDKYAVTQLKHETYVGAMGSVSALVGKSVYLDMRVTGQPDHNGGTSGFRSTLLKIDKYGNKTMVHGHYLKQLTLMGVI